jgi:hypothetical protein
VNDAEASGQRSLDSTCGASVCKAAAPSPRNQRRFLSAMATRISRNAASLIQYHQV